MKGEDARSHQGGLRLACTTCCLGPRHVDLMSPFIQWSLDSQLPMGRKQLRKLPSYQDGHILQCLFRADGMIRREAESQGERGTRAPLPGTDLGPTKAHPLPTVWGPGIGAQQDYRSAGGQTPAIFAGGRGHAAFPSVFQHCVLGVWDR